MALIGNSKLTGFLLAHQVFAQIAALCAAVAALYSQFLGNPIVFDDLSFFEVGSKGVQHISSYRFGLLELRSLPYASLAWGIAWLGQDPWHSRIGNLLLHTAVTVVMYFFLARLLNILPDARNDSRLGSRALAFCAALLFGLHPVASYAVSYLVQRTIVMAMLFSLLAMLAYLHGCLGRRRRWLWASVVFYYLAVISKEHSIMLPTVLLVLTVLLQPDWRGWLRRNWVIFAAFAAIAVMVLLAKKEIFGSVYEPSAQMMLADIGSEGTYLRSVLTQSWLFFKYLVLWFLPNPDWMSIDMREPFAQSWRSPYLLALVAFIAWGAGAIRLLLQRGRPGLLGFAMLFPWLMFMTEFSAVRIQEGFVLYRSYLWVVGIFVGVSLLFSLLPRRMAIVMTTVIASAFFAVAMERLSTMSHPLLLWNDAAKLVKDRDDLPGVYRIYYNRGAHFNKVNLDEKAIADFEKVIALEPEFTPAYGNMGASYLKLHEWEKAAEAFSQVIEIASKTGEQLDMRPYYGRAIAYEAMGELAQAKLDYQVSCHLAKKGCEKL